MKKIIYIYNAFLLLMILTQAQAQTVYFNGLGRALVTVDKLSGEALKNDQTSARRGTGGYTLFDLGVNAQPSISLRASAILRIRNEFGGFYGDGGSVYFRQLKLDGIIAKKVKYEVGDLDLMLTPYTLYNSDVTWNDFESDLFAQRRGIVEYENFNFGNKWRLQGFNAETKLKFSKGIESIEIGGFATRIKNADYMGFSVPDRILTGGKIDILQSRMFKLSFNNVNMNDIQGTIPDTTVEFKNHVLSSNFKLMIPVSDFQFGAVGEGGFSDYSYKRASDTAAVTKDEYFYDAGVYATYVPLNLKFSANYRDVGPDFNSPGAQTRRIHDLMEPALFGKYRSNAVVRDPMLLDRFSDETIRNTTILHTLLTYNPKYNNATPYGIATPNRKGMTYSLAAGDIEKLYKAEVTASMLSEINGEGINAKRKYTTITAGAILNVNKLIDFDKSIKLSAGIRQENTQRKDSNAVDLKTASIDAGLTVEVLNGLDVLAGVKTLKAKGNEYYAIRDEFNRLSATPTEVKYNDNESVFALGLRYRFSKNTYLTGQWHNANLKFNDDNANSYKVNQVFLNYTMLF